MSNGPMKINIECGKSVELPAYMPVPVEVTAVPVEVTAGHQPQALIPPPHGLPGAAFRIHVVTPPIQMDATENFEEAIKSQIADVSQIPSGSTLVIGAEAGSVDPERLGRLAEEVEGLRTSGADVNAEIQVFEAER